ncbi:hypothetical protein [Streptomyces sp. BE133]|uniref:hypothetical protein n=1 Tax=Streptomyces sp. BE133 TaxID=3002523 RepID=UPI002E7967AC|nr:hypothetical protein [Streptomyces sp. BE133]MEE1806722.1 hypothetical protein [Streptomyces sp. BE133]
MVDGPVAERGVLTAPGELWDAAARTDRDAARQLLVLLTLGCRTLDRFEEQRAFLFGVGVPAEFLPSARELGRFDLA